MHRRNKKRQNSKGRRLPPLFFARASYTHRYHFLAFCTSSCSLFRLACTTTGQTHQNTHMEKATYMNAHEQNPFPVYVFSCSSPPLARADDDARGRGDDKRCGLLERLGSQQARAAAGEGADRVAVAVGAEGSSKHIHTEKKSSQEKNRTMRCARRVEDAHTHTPAPIQDTQTRMCWWRRKRLPRTRTCLPMRSWFFRLTLGAEQVVWSAGGFRGPRRS